MIPPICSDDTRSPGEVQLFQQLRDDPVTEGWTVLHSLDLSEHVSQVAGEIDFLVLVPGLGVVALEVKGHQRVRRKDGVWYLGNDTKGEVRGPFKQAADATHSIRSEAMKRVESARSVPFWSAVAFPFVTFDDRSPEWHDWQVIDRQVLAARSIGDAIVGVLRGAREHLRGSTSWFDGGSPEPTDATVEALVAALRGDFEVHETPRSRRRRLQEEVLRYTNEQAAALDQVEENPRVLFDGPAGTGKTVLAVESARRAAERGDRVLLLCFNRHLAARLRDETAEQPGITARTLHSHLLELSGQQRRPSGEGPRYWTDDLPEAALGAALERDTPPYDVLVMDEAQDLARDTYIDVLDLEVVGGLASGRWFAFGDLANQAIYDGDAEGFAGLLAARTGGGFARFGLTANCRNTPRIAAYAELLGDLQRGYTRVLRPDDGREPRTTVIRPSERSVDVLIGVLEELQRDGFSGSDVAILSPMRDGLATAVLDDPWRSRLAPIGDRRGAARISYGTIHEFKGLEAAAVVLTDITGFDEADRRLSYVGMTRALHRLHLIVDERSRDELVRLLVS